jgi:rubrerythrin
MSGYNVVEILKIAVNIEKNAVTFYAAAAEQDVSEPIRKLMSDLSTWEKQHVSLFSRMVSEWEDKDAVSFDPEDHVEGYLRAVASGKIFTAAKLEKEMPKPGDSAIQLLERALQREQEAIVLFLALRDSLTDPDDKKAVEDLVREEMSHVSFLLTKKTEL